MRILILIFFFSSQLLAQGISETQSQQVLIVYGSDTCHYCIETKEILTEKKINFQYYDVDTNRPKLQEMLDMLEENNFSLSNVQLPVVDRNGDVFMNDSDFDQFIEKLIKNE